MNRFDSIGLKHDPEIKEVGKEVPLGGAMGYIQVKYIGSDDWTALHYSTKEERDRLIEELAIQTGGI